jgi:NADPH:quinone reductase-like Zn-dependent oxidoreductase
VQIAKHLGAEVTGVCSATNLELVRSLGADKVLDYTQEDFTLGAQTYDVVFDAVGKLDSSYGKKPSRRQVPISTFSPHQGAARRTRSRSGGRDSADRHGHHRALHVRVGHQPEGVG